MNIHYRIVKVDPSSHGLLIRYFTDKVTEMDLAGPLNGDGTPVLNADGYPLATRTDVFMSLYETPTPSQEEIERRIMLNAPVDWLKLQEDIKDPNVNTKMLEARNLTGESKSFTIEDIETIRSEMRQQSQQVQLSESDALYKSYEVVTSIIDAVKLLKEKDPSIVVDLIDTLKQELETPQ